MASRRPRVSGVDPGHVIGDHVTAVADVGQGAGYPGCSRWRLADSSPGPGMSPTTRDRSGVVVMGDLAVSSMKDVLPTAGDPSRSPMVLRTHFRTTAGGGSRSGRRPAGVGRGGCRLGVRNGF